MEQDPRAGKKVRAEQATNDTAETEEKQSSSAASHRQLDGEGAVSGEYSFQNHPVRTLTTQGETWFRASEVCEVLEIVNPRHALSRLEADEKAVATDDTLGGVQAVNLINESGSDSLSVPVSVL
jgi:BRO family, N-terminal domain